MKKTPIVVAAVVIAGAAAPYAIGMQAEKQFAHSHAWLQQELIYPQLEVEAGEFKRGWLGSESSTRFTITSGEKDAEPVTFELQHRINQIPSPGAMMTVESELVLPPEAAEKLQTYFNDTPPLSAVTKVGYGGSSTTTLSSPGYSGALQNDAETHLEWKGLNGSVSSNGQDHLSMTLNAPGLKLKDEEGEMTLSSLSYSSELKQGAHELWYGTADGTLEGMLVDVTTPQNGPFRMQLQKLRFDSEQREDGDLVDIDGKFTIDTLDVNGYTVENAIYDTGYHNLDAASLSAINRVMRETMRQQPQQPEQMMAEILQHVEKLLSRQPELHIRQLQVDTPQGQVSGNMKLALTEGFSPQMMSDVSQLLDVMQLDMEASLPQVMLREMFSNSARSTVVRMANAQGQELNPDELQQQVETLTEQQIQGLLSQGMMVEKGESYASTLHYAPHTLTINDQDATPMIQGFLQ